MLDPKAASDDLIIQHLWIVRSIAARLKGSLLFSAEWDELISAGNLGLVKAGRSYQGIRGCQFKTYAFKCVRGEMIRAFTRIDGHHDSAMINFCPLDELQDHSYSAPQDGEIYQAEKLVKLSEALERLAPRHRMVIDTYLEERSLVGLAKDLGYKRDRIMKWQRTAIKQLAANVT